MRAKTNLHEKKRYEDPMDQDEKFKFIDGLSFLEIINLISIGIASYDCWEHVPSDIAIDNGFTDSSKLSIQSDLGRIL